MSRTRFGRLGAVAAVCFLLAVSMGAVPAAGASGQASKSGTLTPRLEQLSQPGAATASTGDQAALVGLPAAGPGALLRLSPDRVVVEIRLADVGATSVDRLRSAGAQIVGVSGSLRTVTASVRPADLPALGAAIGVQSVQEVLRPMVNRQPTDLARAAAPAARAAPCNPLISEGLGQLRADVARNHFSVDGTGTTVGVLSDSFDTNASAPTHASNDVASGNLPGPANPCGHLTAVNKVDDSCVGTCSPADEGRAMSQIVHGLAPGANLAFATAFTGEQQFANNIVALSGAPGAKDIVDDVTYFDEPVYQDGPVAAAVTQVRNAGVSYFSSAANNNMIIAGHDVASYEAATYRGTPCPTLPNTYLDCHNFNPAGGPADNGYDMTVLNGATLRLELQWAQPWYGVSSDLDLFVLDATNGAVLASSVNNNLTTQKPFEIVSWLNNTGAAKNVAVVVSRFTGSGARFKLIHMQNGANGISSVEYSVSAGTDVIGPTIFGHNGTGSAYSVAAVPYNSNTSPEYYTSHGPVTLLYGPVNGTTPAAPLGSPQVLAKPDFAATDCGRNTFFGSFDGVNWRFCGTSAAAPHAAAVAALLRQANPAITPAQIGVALAGTARSVGGAPSSVVGAGLIDADAALGSFAGLLRVASNPAVPTQVSIDGNIADSWGLVWMKGSAGSHTVCLAHVDGWTEPPCQVVTVSIGATTTVIGNFTQRGLLRVLNSPAVASAISVDGNPTDEYGMWTDIPTGAHTICWGKVVGWDPPPCQNITLTTTGMTVTGNFTANGAAVGQTGVGLLRVTTSPAVPSQITLKAGAGPTYIADHWGLQWLEVAAGSYTVCFGRAVGWTEPPCQTLTVTSGATTTVTGNFTQRGMLRVQTSPAVSATILVDGVPRDDWGMWTDIPTGSHTVCFGSVPGFVNAPPCQVVPVNAGATTNITGTYS